MTEVQLGDIIKQIVDDNLWILAGALVFLFWQDSLKNLLAGIMFYLNPKFKVDQYVILNGRDARINDIGLRYISFWMKDTSTIMEILNSEIGRQQIERFPDPDPAVYRSGK